MLLLLALGLGLGMTAVFWERKRRRRRRKVQVCRSAWMLERKMHGGFGCPAPNSPHGEMLLPKTLKPHVRPTSPPCLPREA